MFVSLKNNTYILNTSNIMWIKWIETKNVALVKLLDGTEEWLNNKSDFETVMKAVTKESNSNDLKETKQIQPKVTTRRGKQHERNYHKPAQIPTTHVFVGKFIDANCLKCHLPFQHPCHNTSNPIEEKCSCVRQEEESTDWHYPSCSLFRKENSDANRPDETPTNR